MPDSVEPCAPRRPVSAGVNMQTSRRSSSSRGDQVVRVVLVERVHRADHDLVLGAVHLDDLAAPSMQ